jgi:hypothetical protein
MGIIFDYIIWNMAECGRLLGQEGWLAPGLFNMCFFIAQKC